MCQILRRCCDTTEHHVLWYSSHSSFSRDTKHSIVGSDLLQSWLTNEWNLHSQSKLHTNINIKIRYDKNAIRLKNMSHFRGWSQTFTFIFQLLQPNKYTYSFMRNLNMNCLLCCVFLAHILLIYDGVQAVDPNLVDRYSPHYSEKNNRFLKKSKVEFNTKLTQIWNSQSSTSHFFVCASLGTSRCHYLGKQLRF